MAQAHHQDSTGDQSVPAHFLTRLTASIVENATYMRHAASRTTCQRQGQQERSVTHPDNMQSRNAPRPSHDAPVTTPSAQTTDGGRCRRNEPVPVREHGGQPIATRSRRQRDLARPAEGGKRGTTACVRPSAARPGDREREDASEQHAYQNNPPFGHDDSMKPSASRNSV